MQMERTKAPKAVLTGAEWEDLVKLQEFVQTASEADLGAVCSSACIYTSTTSDSISGKFTTMRIDLPDIQISMSFRFRCNLVSLPGGSEFSHIDTLVDRNFG